jgi:hypothetical protein
MGFEPMKKLSYQLAVGECTSFDWVNKKNANTDSKFASLVTKRVQRKYLWKLDTRLKMKKLMSRMGFEPMPFRTST